MTSCATQLSLVPDEISTQVPVNHQAIHTLHAQSSLRWHESKENTEESKHCV